MDANEKVTISVKHILEAAEQPGTAREILTALFPDVFEKDFKPGDIVCIKYQTRMNEKFVVVNAYVHDALLKAETPSPVSDVANKPIKNWLYLVSLTTGGSIYISRDQLIMVSRRENRQSYP